MPCPSTKPYTGLKNVKASGLACHMLVSTSLIGNNLNVHTKPQKLRTPIHTIGVLIHLLNINRWSNTSTLPYDFMMRFLTKQRDSLLFILRKNITWKILIGQLQPVYYEHYSQ